MSGSTMSASDVAGRILLRRLIIACAAAFALLGMATQASIAQQGANGNRNTLIPRNVAEGVFFMENQTGSGNAGFIITDEGVLVYDADVRNADQTLAFIRKQTDKKVRYVVISHAAGDHATGVWHYREDKPTFIATRRQMRDLYMQEKQQFEERKALGRPEENPYARAEFVTPDLGFDGALTLQFGNITFQLTDEGHGHSTSDVTMFVPQKRIFFMGDLLNTEIHPGQSESAGIIFANVNGWIASLDRIMNRNLPVDTYIPGHGPLHPGRGVADLEEQKRYFVTMRDRVSRRMAQGDNLETIRKTFDPPKEFSDYKRTERLNNFLNLFFHQNIERGY